MIIGLSGKKQSGKDTVAQIIQYLTASDVSKKAYKRLIGGENIIGYVLTDFINKKFADKLKDITCLLLDCSRKKLEDETFKNTPLGKEWDKFDLYVPSDYDDNLILYSSNFTSEKAAKYYNKNDLFYSPSTIDIKKVQLTPRILLQKLGTECGRQIIHPDIWVNSTFNNYSDKDNWVISDVRFPNEVDIIKNKKGLNIRIERYCYDSGEDYLVTNSNPVLRKIGIDLVIKEIPSKEIEKIARTFGYIPLSEQHESETALDEYRDWDYIIQNKGSIKDLIKKVEEILKKEKIL